MEKGIGCAKVQLFPVDDNAEHAELNGVSSTTKFFGSFKISSSGIVFTENKDGSKPLSVSGSPIYIRKPDFQSQTPLPIINSNSENCLIESLPLLKRIRKKILSYCHSHLLSTDNAKKVIITIIIRSLQEALPQIKPLAKS